MSERPWARLLTCLLTYVLTTWLAGASALAQVGGARAPGEMGAEGPRPYQHELPSKRLPITFVSAEDSDVPDLTVYVQPGILPKLGPGGAVEGGAFEPVCRVPCEASLRSGAHVFALGYSDKPVRKLDRALSVRRGERVVLRYQRRLALRLVGWFVLLGSVGAGSAMIAMGQPLEGAADKGLLIGGSLLSALGLGGGLWLANLPDRATGWVESAAP